MAKKRIRRGRKIIQWRRFDKAREWVRSLGLQSDGEWSAYKRGEYARTLGTIPPDIPRAPHVVYQGEGWVGIADWLGYSFLPFEEARAFAHSLNLKNHKEWVAYCRGDYEDRLPTKPKNIPSSPRKTYWDSGWEGFGDWLGTGVIGVTKRKYRDFEDARKFARKLKLKNLREWQQYAKTSRPEDIPSIPPRVYAKEWKGYGDWLGTTNVTTRNRSFLDFEEAREVVRNLKLKNQKEWHRYSKSERPINIPGNPARVYSSEWVSLADWLGKEV